MDTVRLLDPDRIVRLPRVAFERMIADGVFPARQRLHLLDGVIVELSPRGDDHARAIVRTTNLLALVAFGDLEVAVDDLLPRR